MLIMGTGSRYVPPSAAPIIWNVFSQLQIDLLTGPGIFAPIEFVHGECPYGGADLIMASYAAGMGWDVTPYPADTKKYGNRGFYLRNKAMVDLKPKLCLAFPMRGKKNAGTQMTIDLATAAGIPVQEYWIEV